MQANCVNCPNKVYPRIQPNKPFQADFVVVGEASDNSEISNRQMFQGYKGNMVRKCLQVAGIEDVSKVFFTNALLCRPPVGKPINAQAVLCCQDRLINEIQIAQPKVIMALGNIPIQVLTGNFKAKITQEHGRALTSPYCDAPVIANWHPGKVARAPGDYKTFISATQYAVQTLLTGIIKQPPPTTFEVVVTETHLAQVLSKISASPLVAADIETGGFNPRKHPILALGICCTSGHAYIFPAAMIPKLSEYFKDSTNLWIWHNGKFDTSFLQARKLQAVVHHDTILLHYALNETSGTHDLGQLSTEFLGAANYKMSVKGYETAKESGYANVPPEVLYPYLAKDVDYTFQLFQILYARVSNNPELSKLYHDLLIPASAFLQRVETFGIWTNSDAVEVLRVHYLAEIERVSEEITEAVSELWDAARYVKDTGAKTAPATFNPGSPKQLAWLLYVRLRLKPKKRGNYSTAADLIEEFAGQHPFIDLVLERRTLKKALKTYVEGVLKARDEEGRVHTTFGLYITATGRLSSRSPNIQNIKNDKRIKGIYQAPKGRILLEADYKAAELRVLAHISGDTALKQVFLDKRDPHSELAIKSFGELFTEAQRMQAKTVNFGLPYGRTAPSIAEELNISVRAALDMMDEWSNTFPDAWAYLLGCDRAVIEGSTLSTPFGRFRRFGLVTQDMLSALQNEARNFRIQSISSDLTLISGMTVEKPLQQIGNGRIVNLVHDSLLIELDDDPIAIQAAGQLVSHTMSQTPVITLGTVVPFVAELKVGKIWGSMTKYLI